MANTRNEIGVEYIAFHCAIGTAVAQWAHVENGLFNLAHFAFGEPENLVFGASYNSIENFRAKLGFVDQAIRHSKPFEPHLAEWSTIHDHIASLASRARNKIAHCRTIAFPQAPPGRRYAIVPIGYQETRFKSKKALPPSDALCLSDIDLAARQFSRASNILFDLLARAQGLPEPFGELARQEPPRRSLADIARQIDEALQPPA